MKKKISIVVPVYNEEENIPEFFTQVKLTTQKLEDKFDFEFIFTDNHSTDRTFEILNTMAKVDATIKVCRFSKNFGYQNSILTGYSLVTGDAAIQLDCDLQDPPEMMVQFLEYWEKGFKVVYGIRRSRQENIVLKKTRDLFYTFINSLSDDFLPPNAGDFRLLDRRIINELVKDYDASPYIRGAVASLGFDQVGIPYDRNARTKGKSKFNLFALMNLAFDGIFGSSLAPLRFATYLGGFVLLITFLLATGYFIARVFFGQGWPAGFATLAMLILASMSINLIFMGILGAYIGRIFLQVRGKPNSIVENSINIESSKNRFPNN